MYLKTPQKYTGNNRRRFPIWRILFWVIALAGIGGGWWVYQNQETIEPMVNQQLGEMVAQGQYMIATMSAPTPAPTENPANRLNRANSSWVSGRVEEAIDEYQLVMDALPNDVISHYNLTMAYIVEGRYAEAIESAERTVTADPFSSDAWAIRALSLTRNGDAGAALASGLQALQLNPDNPRAHAFLTEVYLDLELFARAEESATRALELSPDSPEAYFARGLVRQLVDFDRVAAREDYQTAYELAPYRIDAAIETAWLDAALNDFDTAINTLNTLKDTNPDNTSILYALGFMYFAGLGDPNQAADELSRCVNVDEQNAACFYYYGRVLIALEQYNDAAQRLSRAVNLTTQTPTPNPRFHYWAGEAQIYLGNCTAALEHLRPGYELALAQENDELISALQNSIRECSAFDTNPANPVPSIPDEALPEPTVPADI